MLDRPVLVIEGYGYWALLTESSLDDFFFFTLVNWKRWTIVIFFQEFMQIFSRSSLGRQLQNPEKSSALWTEQRRISSASCSKWPFLYAWGKLRFLGVKSRKNIIGSVVSWMCWSRSRKKLSTRALRVAPPTGGCCWVIWQIPAVSFLIEVL